MTDYELGFSEGEADAFQARAKGIRRVLNGEPMGEYQRGYRDAYTPRHPSWANRPPKLGPLRRAEVSKTNAAYIAARTVISAAGASGITSKAIRAALPGFSQVWTSKAMSQLSADGQVAWVAIKGGVIWCEKQYSADIARAQELAAQRLLQAKRARYTASKLMAKVAAGEDDEDEFCAQPLVHRVIPAAQAAPLTNLPAHSVFDLGRRIALATA